MCIRDRIDGSPQCLILPGPQLWQRRWCRLGALVKGTVGFVEVVTDLRKFERWRVLHHQDRQPRRHFPEFERAAQRARRVMGRPDARREDALVRTLNGGFVDLRRLAPVSYTHLTLPT